MTYHNPDATPLNPEVRTTAADQPPAQSHGRIHAASSANQKLLRIPAQDKMSNLESCYAMLFADVTVAGQRVEIRKTIFPATRLGWISLLHSAKADGFVVENDTKFVLPTLNEVEPKPLPTGSADTDLVVSAAGGKKYDGNKPQYSYLFSTFKEPLNNVNDVLYYGANRYGMDNWKNVEPKRFIEAMLRHAIACSEDFTSRDDESQLLHLAHLATNALFLLYFVGNPR